MNNNRRWLIAAAAVFLVLTGCKSSSSPSGDAAGVGGNGGGNGGGPAEIPSIYSVANQCFRLQSADGRFVREQDGYLADTRAASEAAGFYLKPTALGSYLLLSAYERNLQPTENNAVVSGDAGSKRLLGISDPQGEFLDELGNFVGEVDVLLTALGDTADFILDPTPLGGDPVRDAGEELVDGAGQANMNIAPAVTVVADANDLAVWVLESPAANLFALRSQITGQRLAVGEDGTLGLTAGDTDSTLFRLLPAQGCDSYPEASVNAELVSPGQSPKVFWNDQGGDIYGWVDDHAHITAYEFIGGRVNYGATHHKFGVDHALGNCEVNHGPQGSLGTLEMVTSDNAFAGHETVGWPSYNAWPRSGSLQHHQTYYKWLERAFLAGQKILVNLVTHNEVLCQIYPLKQNDCDGMANTRLQIQRTYELQDYVDAQSGGPGQGWFRVVTSPQEARAVIADGKMAVVLGIEMSKVLNCGEFLDQPECDYDQLVSRLDEMYDLGARVIFPVHKFDNAFGGHLPHSGFALGPFLTAGNLAETGHPLEVEECPLDENGNDDFSGEPNDPRNSFTGDGAPEGIFDYLLANYEYLLRQAPDGTVTPLQPLGSDTQLCNIRGLTVLGRTFIEELVKRGMMIDVDHMSRRAAAGVLDQLDSLDYPVISSHDWTGSETLLNRIAAEGGFIGRFARDGREGWIERLLGMSARYGDKPFFGGGIASDVNGIAHLPYDPREGAEDNESMLQYPFLSYDGRVRFNRQVTGDRVFGLYDGRGVAHYGLYADYIADAQQFGGPDARRGLDIFFRSAEAYLRMWEIVESRRQVD